MPAVQRFHETQPKCNHIPKHIFHCLTSLTTLGWCDLFFPPIPLHTLFYAERKKISFGFSMFMSQHDLASKTK